MVSSRIRRSSRGRRWRRFKRAARANPRRVVAAAAAAVVVVLAMWVGWRTFKVSQDLRAVEKEAQIMRAALVRGDAPGATRALARFREAADSADRRTGGLTWWVIERAPWLGDDARGIATTSEVLSGLGRDGLEPVLRAADQVTANAFRPQDKTFPLDRISALVAPAQDSEGAFDLAVQKLDGLDSNGYVDPLRQRIDALRALVSDARSTLESTYRAARLMPSLLGRDGPRNYLLVLQNNAELRSGGGLPGAVSLLRMDRGVIDIVEQSDMAELTRGRAPAVTLTNEERRVFGPILGWAPVNATLTPDFERAAEIIRAHWLRVRGTRLDGVFFVDPVAVSYLLRGVGPVKVPEYSMVTADTVVKSVESDIYLLSADREVQSDYQQAVAHAVFDAFANGSGDSAETIRGLARGVTEGRIRVHSFRREDQAEIAGTEIAGEFDVEVADSAPAVGIYINDAGPTKMQYYLRYEAAVFARSCTDSGTQVIAGDLDLYSDTPANVESLPPAVTGEGYGGQRVAPGSQLLVIYLTSPIGGDVLELRIDGQKLADPVIEPLAGRQLARVAIELPPQGRHKVEFVMSSGDDQPDDVELLVTPGAFPGSSNGSTRSACDIR